MSASDDTIKLEVLDFLCKSYAIVNITLSCDIMFEFLA